jgi:hypothetical protein
MGEYLFVLTEVIASAVPVLKGEKPEQIDALTGIRATTLSNAAWIV